MSEILNELQEVKKASQEQTAASQAQTAEVAGKMAQIDQKVAEAEKEFNDFISGDFDYNVSNARQIKVYVDPVDGNDANSGSSSAMAIKSSSRLSELVNKSYKIAHIYFRNGTTFVLEHGVSVADRIVIQTWQSSDGVTDKPVIIQGKAQYAYLSALDISITSCLVYTYSALQNEELPEVYAGRAMFGSARKLSLIFSSVFIVDNQLFHVHNAGSGDDFHRCSLSFYNASILAVASESGVAGTKKTIYTFFASPTDFPLDMFAVGFSVDLNGLHATFKDFLSVKVDHIITNINLDLA